MAGKSFLTGLFGSGKAASGAASSLSKGTLATPKTTVPVATPSATPFNVKSRIKQIGGVKARNAAIMKSMFGD